MLIILSPAKTLDYESASPVSKATKPAMLTAAAQLGVDAAACLAIEDSVTGAASATAAGCEVLVVPHMVRVPDGPRRRTLPSLAGTTPDTLRTLFA